jgi:hypothetical protein
MSLYVSSGLLLWNLNVRFFRIVGITSLKSMREVLEACPFIQKKASFVSLLLFIIVWFFYGCGRIDKKSEFLRDLDIMARYHFGLLIHN